MFASSGEISPLLANVYLHEVLDKWFAQDVAPRLKGQARLIRYADDFVVVFSREDDARRFMSVLPARFGKYGLELHPEKTRLVEFRRPPTRPPPSGSGRGGGGTFNLLGFTHYWGISQKRNWVVKLKTASDRFSRALKRITEWCRAHRHDPVCEQWTTLAQKVRGHYEYYGVVANSQALARFYHSVQRAWIKWLRRRSNSTPMSWERAAELLGRYPLPQPQLPRLRTA